MKQLLGVLGLTLATSMASAATKTVENNVGTLLLEGSVGSEYSQFGVGLGIKPENNRPGFGGLYYEQVDLDHGVGTRIQLLGFRGFSVEGNGEDPRGADITLGLSRTEHGDYKRTGLSGKAALFVPLTQKLTWTVGGDIRPTFLSFDWNNDVLTEFAVKAGLDWRLMDNLGVFGHYYHEGILSDSFDEERLGNGVVAGFNLVW
ncbi:MAG: hypothetical protein CMG93_12195 [Marinomonas sp.]|uniref:hypothetical protein n=1 Tax=Marinomonas communis TaxID=28254 RepID=UPI000C350D80|nr:hypothetical protein [Marinomonas communis]MAF16729.1 hypothetical protein [Marinomonas sp.]MCC4272788.1 hypothetical protein [Marinomonas communis]RUM49085.1 MAG: hypothetical protein DSY85_16395 [Marinomonas sp.]RUM55261.1 MAG: hypothetical protein DSY86_02140 [Marinomonas sp.]